MSRRFPYALVISALVLPAVGCFSPDYSAGGTDTDSGSESSAASSTVGDPTTMTASTTATTTATTDGTSTGTGTDTDGSDDLACTDECMPEGETCNGDDLETCTLNDTSGCNELTVERCELGCASGACLETLCGDGTIQDGEDCDDANADPGDGCDSDCAPENGWECAGEPSTCIAPDLVVAIDEAVFDGDLFVTYTVTNLGGLASGEYDVDLWQARAGGFADPPSVGNSGEAVFTHESLDPLLSATFVGFIADANFGDSVAFAVVDTGEAIVESDEVNNVSLGHAWSGASGNLHTTIGGPSTPVSIPDNNVTGAVASVDVDVTNSSPLVWFSVSVTHPSLADLSLEVTAPNGATRVLAGEGDMSDAHMMSTTFRDGAPALATGAAPYNSAFDPVGPGSGNIGPDANGTWTLRVVDAGAGAQGRINAFAVTVFDPTP